MTFKFGLTLAARGSNKLRRFKTWAMQSLPDLEYRLPPQAPIAAETLTIRLRSQRDAERVRSALPDDLP